MHLCLPSLELIVEVVLVLELGQTDRQTDTVASPAIGYWDT